MSAPIEKIAVFYHLGQFGPRWKELFAKHMEQLHPVVEEAERFILCIQGQLPLPFIPPKAEIIYNTGGIGEEGDTLVKLHSFCQDNKDWKVLYTHSKGVTRPPEFADPWTDYLFEVVVNQRELCWKKLKTSVGPFLRNTVYFNPPNLHETDGYLDYGLNMYPGNFWWANSNYVATLDPEPLITGYLGHHYIGTRLYSEHWILSGEEGDYFTHPESGSFLYILDENSYVPIFEFERKWIPNILYTGTEPDYGSLKFLQELEICSEYFVVTENPDKYNGLKDTYFFASEEVLNDVLQNSVFMEKNKCDYHWVYSPGFSQFKIELLDKEEFFDSLRNTGTPFIECFYNTNIRGAVYWWYYNGRVRHCPPLISHSRHLTKLKGAIVWHTVD